MGRLRLNRKTHGRLLLGLLIVVVLFGKAWAPAAAEGAIAHGHAQIIAGGISTIPAGEVAWTLTERTAPLSSEATGLDNPNPSFVLGTQRAIVAGASETDIALLDKGEARFLPAGAAATVASAGDRRTRYLQIELAPASTGITEALSDVSFELDGARRDFDLVRDVLANGETTELAASVAPIFVVATAGEVRVTADGERAATVSAGESVSIEGPVTIEAIGSGRATFVAAIAGAEVDSAGPAPAPASTPVTQEPALSDGAIGVVIWLCDPGVTAETISGDNCDTDATAAQLSLSGDGIDGALANEDATQGNPGFQWQGLPYGSYYLYATSLIDGGSNYFIPGSAAVGGDSFNGYTIAIDASAPTIGIDVYVFQVDSVETGGAVQIRFAGCPLEAIGQSDIDRDQCEPLMTDVGATLNGLDTGIFMTLAEANSGGGLIVSFEWPDLPYGTYRIADLIVPDAYDQVFTLPSDATVTISADSPYGVVEVFALLPAADAEEIDSDGDGIFDQDEIVYGTDPYESDTDFDGFDDAVEFEWFTDPLDPDSYPAG